MKMKYFLLLFFITFLICGCYFDPYQDSKYGELAVSAWFDSKYLGDTRKNIENIDEIISKECKFVESKGNKYVFSCKIVYKEKGETVIPLSKNSTINVYAVFIKEKGKTYDYKVYNSSSKDKVWEEDEYLNY
ncbi:MAG: hypothetical protein ACI31R_01175 [Bacilli bacterium]